MQGSNLFNLMGVLGVASIVAPGGIQVADAIIYFDLPIMIVVAFACLPMFFTGVVISRQEGALLMGYYVVYTLYLILAANHHEALQRFSAIMLYFIVPLTLVTLISLAIQERRRKNRQKPI